MTLYHLEKNDLRGAGGESRSATARLLGGARAAISVIHRAIIVSKLRRIGNELVFHSDEGGEPLSPDDLLRYPQRPLILGDKWDF